MRGDSSKVPNWGWLAKLPGTTHLHGACGASQAQVSGVVRGYSSPIKSVIPFILLLGSRGQAQRSDADAVFRGYCKVPCQPSGVLL
jgi:hypothetical protein